MHRNLQMADDADGGDNEDGKTNGDDDVNDDDLPWTPLSTSVHSAVR